MTSVDPQLPPLMEPTPVGPHHLQALKEALVDMETYQPLHVGSAPVSAPAVARASGPQWNRRWSPLALVASVICLGAAYLGTANPWHFKYVHIALGMPMLWLALATGLLLASVMLMRVHLLLRIVIAALLAGPVAAGLILAFPHVPPKDTLQLITGTANVDAMSLVNPSNSRITLVTEGNQTPLKRDLTSRRFIVGCLAPKTDADQLSSISWVRPNVLSIRLADQRNAVVTLTSSGRPTRVDDPDAILTRPGLFGC